MELCETIKENEPRKNENRSSPSDLCGLFFWRIPFQVPPGGCIVDEDPTCANKLSGKRVSLSMAYNVLLLAG